MCGIAGALDLRGSRRFPPETLARMSAALQHRGPDGEGFFLAAGIAMAARRLALVDPEHGAQPVTNEMGDVVACCNGELFDHDDLRKALVLRGHHVRSRCDVELWPHLWEEHGEGLFAHARGQFALALWDARTRSLLLARDRAGICPLYVTEAEGWLLWSSEIKGLLASGMVAREVDHRAIDHLFIFCGSPARRSFFTGIRSIAPGESLLCRDGHQVIRRHSDLEFSAHGEERRTADPATLVDELEGALRRSISRRLRADAPVATYLSGGVDSNTVLALATAVQGRAPASFTIGFDDVRTDETEWARQSAAAAGSELTVVRMSAADVVSQLDALHLAAEAPVVDTSAAYLMRLAETVRAHGFKAVLTGDGADECMAGYVWFRVEKVLSVLGRWTGGLVPRALRSLVFSLVGGRHRPPSGPLAELRTAQRDFYDPFARARSDLFAPSLQHALAGHDPYDELDVDPAQMRRWHPLNRSLYVEYRVLLAGHLMQAKGDRVAMRSGVETRHPFLDDEVIDLCASIAPKYKLRGLTDKWLLRQVAGRYLPRAAARRRKTMFRTPLSRMVLGSRRPPWIDQLLSERSLQRTGMFDRAHVERERRRQAALPAVTPRRIVMDGALTAVVACQLWHHLFISHDLCELPPWTAPAPSSASLELARREDARSSLAATVSAAPPGARP